MNELSLVMYRRSELQRVGGDHCAAVLLQAIRYWSSGGAVWVDKTQTEIVAEIDNMYGLNRVAAALKRLVAAGLIERRKNPYQRQVQTYQYRASPVDVPASGVPQESSDMEGHGADIADSFKPEEIPVQSLNLKTEPDDIAASSLYESESESDWESESSPRVSAREPDDDDCPAAIRAEIQRITQQIGATRVRDVLTRCEGKARSWHYVIKALRNERDQKRPSPSSAAPPPSGRDYLSGPYASFFENYQGVQA